MNPHSNIAVRLAAERDIPAVLAISNWAALHTSANFAIEPEPLMDWLAAWRQTQARYPWFIAEAQPDGRIVGFAKASPHRGRCAYAYTAEVSVYVHADAHGRGVGTALYQRLIPTLQAQGYITLLAGITSPNPASERLHAAFAFQPVGVFERVGWKFNRWHDVGYWELILSDAASPQARILSVHEAEHRS